MAPTLVPFGADQLLTPEQKEAMQLQYGGRIADRQGYVPPADANAAAHPTIRPMGATAAPAAAPELAPMGGAPAPVAAAPGLPSLARPTEKQSVAAGMQQMGDTAKEEGKRQYAELRPEVTAPSGTPEADQQKLAQEDFDKLHPYGADISAHPGTLGKVGHVLSKIGNVAGDIVAPGVMANIEGTDLNKARQRNDTMRNFGEDIKNEQEQATTAGVKEGNEEIPHINPDTGETEMITRKSLPMIEAAEIKAQASKDVATTKSDATTEQKQAALNAQLLKMGYDENGKPLPDDKLSPQQKATRELTESKQGLADAQAEFEKSKNDPSSPQFKLAQERLNAAARDYQLRLQSEQLHANEFANKLNEQQFLKPSGQTQSRGEAAESALELLPGLQKDVETHAADFGPIIGRIARGEIKWGNVDPEVQRVYAELESFYALQPSIHGFRNAEFVKDFDTFVGNLQTNPKGVIAGLQGLKPTLEAVNRSGKTFQRRIMPGQPETPATPAKPGGGGGAAAVPSFKDFLNSQQKPAGS
jgi:hypothetical protein